MKTYMNKLQIGLLKVLFLFLIGQHSIDAQGVEFLSEAEYQSLPNVNWDILVPNTSAVLTNTNEVVMLKTPPIRNQGEQGSCVAWALGYASMSIMEGKYFNYDWSKATRSPSYIYNQIKKNSNNCKRGIRYIDAFNLMMNQGVCSYSLMPYITSDCKTQPNEEQKVDASHHKLLNYGIFKDVTSVSDIKKVLKAGYPVIVSCFIYRSFDEMWNTDGIWDTFNKNEYKRGGHGTCIVGYDDNKKMFKVQNSWGKRGGDNGFYWITYDLVRKGCLKRIYVAYGITSSPLKPTIQGSNVICNRETYTIENMPDGLRVNWSTDNDKLQLVSGQGKGTAVFKKKGFGSCTIKAKIFGTSNGLLKKQVIVSGIPTASSINVYVNSSIYRVIPYEFLGIEFPNCNDVRTRAGHTMLYAPGKNGLYATSIFDSSVWCSLSTGLGYSWRIKTNADYWNYRRVGIPEEFESYDKAKVAFGNFVIIKYNPATVYPPISYPLSPVLEVKLTNPCGCSEWKEVANFDVSTCEGCKGFFLLSPNEDGINDVFELGTTESESQNNQSRNAENTYDLTIFNRSGATVYKKGDYMRGNQRFGGVGNIKGFVRKKLPDGDYFLILKQNNNVSKHYMKIKRK